MSTNMKSSISDYNRRQVRHRMADARWRSSVASCFTLLKEVVLCKDTWDPENAGPCRISKVKILNETADYIKRLEDIIISDLQSNDDTENSEITLGKIRSDFLHLEVSKLVNVGDVGPYVQEYLHLLAMEEVVNSHQKKYKNSKSIEEEANNNMVVLNHLSCETMWKVPSFKNKVRRKTKKYNRPVIVNVQKWSPHLMTPKCNILKKSTSLQPLPALPSKTMKLAGCGLPGVKRCLLDEMNGMEDLESSQASTAEIIDSSQMSADESNEFLILSADSEQQIVPDDPSLFTKIMPSDCQVPSQDLNFASEIEVITTSTGSQQIIRTCGNDKQRRKKKQENDKQLRTVPCLNSTSNNKKRQALEDVTGKMTDENSNLTYQEIQPVDLSMANKEYTALKNDKETPRKLNHLVKFSPVYSLSPSTPETSLLTHHDPFLISANSEHWTSPIGLSASGSSTDEGKELSPHVKTEPAWPSPHHAENDHVKTEFFEGFFGI